MKLALMVLAVALSILPAFGQSIVTPVPTREERLADLQNVEVSAPPVKAVRSSFKTKTTFGLAVLDAATIGSAWAESYTSAQCLDTMARAHVKTSTCTKQRYLNLEVAPALVFATHVIAHKAPNSSAKWVSALFLTPWDVINIDAAANNVRVSSVGYLQKTWPPTN